MTGYIYFLQEKDTNNIFYVGSTLYPDTRKVAHRSSSKVSDSPLYQYIKSSILDFTLNIIEEIEIESKRELLEVEIYWIHQFKTWGFNVKNSVLYRAPLNNHADSPVPIRLGELRPLLEEKASKLNISLHALIVKILKSHLEKGKKKIKQAT